MQSFISLIIHKASQVLKNQTELLLAVPPFLVQVSQGAGSPQQPRRCHFKAQDPQITRRGLGLQGWVRSWADRADVPERPSGPQESL